MRRSIVLAAVVIVLGGSLASEGFAADASLEQVLVETASTPQQHAALAAYYDGKAAEARKEAADHREMAKAYGGVKASQLSAMKAHCDKLAALADEQAKDYEEMAAAHRGMAK